MSSESIVEKNIIMQILKLFIHKMNEKQAQDSNIFFNFLKNILAVFFILELFLKIGNF